MNVQTIIRRAICYSMIVLPVACFQQEIKPQPDQNTRACLIKEYTNYSIVGSDWTTSSFRFEYNKDGNPVMWTFRNQDLKINKIYTLEYDGLKLKRMNYYTNSGGIIFDKNNKIPKKYLLAYRKYTMDNDISSIIEKTFVRNSPNYEKDSTFIPYFSREHTFIRNVNNDLRLTKVEFVTTNTDGTEVLQRYGIYKLIKYDSENRNVNEIWSKEDPRKDSVLVDRFSGFDLNGRSLWNANFWLSFIQDEGDKFDDKKKENTIGFWSENNLSIATSFSKFYYIYELNEQGFACISSQKGSDRLLNYPDEAFYYYYNCECRKR